MPPGTCDLFWSIDVLPSEIATTTIRAGVLWKALLQNYICVRIEIEKVCKYIGNTFISQWELPR